jgi:hypothetical protein
LGRPDDLTKKDFRMLTIRRLAMLVTVTVAFSGASQAQAARPTVTPSVKRTFVAYDSYQVCPYAYLCAFVPYGRGLYRFDFRACRRYRIANWYGYGSVFNAQYGGVRFTFFDSRGHDIFHSTRRKVFRDINWGPVYSIRPC